ncbi:MAG: hypothetical protein PHN35_07115 [Clostridia bacterium]|nr:hypothetical protein [Clostridia bacterium]
MFENLEGMTNEELFAGMTALDAEMNRITVEPEKEKISSVIIKSLSSLIGKLFDWV